jgi:EAL domain-containing protein (putative c-di-GMP-specific phosphodiesterase class I)
MSNDAVLATLNRHLAQGDLPADRIGFEITETTTVGNYDAARDFIRQIRRYGCRFSIDDFGSGNASYGYLRNLRTEALKIDGAYVKDMVDDPDLQAMVKSMNDIGHSLGMKTVAEYVATPEILALVREIGVDYAQGYEVAMPVHIDELARL